MAHDRWPETLAELSEGITIDPFTGEPLLYRRTNRGCIIYSVGMNLLDDGGVCDMDSDKDDVIFRLLDADRRNSPGDRDVQ